MVINHFLFILCMQSMPCVFTSKPKSLNEFAFALLKVFGHPTTTNIHDLMQTSTVLGKNSLFSLKYK